MEIAVETDFTAVERECADLLAAGTAESFFLAPWWWRTMIEAGIAAGDRAEFVIARQAGRAVMLLALQRGAGQVSGLSGPYTCLYRPLIAPGLGGAAIAAAAAALAMHVRPAGLCRLEAMDAAAPWFADFEAGLRRGGMWPMRFDHFGNWSESVAGLDWAAYIAGRPGLLRETVRRKMRRGMGMDFSIVTGEGLEEGLAAYEDVYARSWKVPEPFPRFNATLMRNAAAEGTLRLGLLREDGRTVAAQIWIVAGGRAMVSKLAHDETMKSASPGTVLTARMVRHLLDEERVEMLDFGRGDDPYKKSWTVRREQRIGLLLANPLSARGAVALARHALGRLRRRVTR